MLQRIFRSESHCSVRSVAFLFSDQIYSRFTRIMWFMPSVLNLPLQWLLVDVCFLSQLSGPVVDLNKKNEFGELAYDLLSTTTLFQFLLFVQKQEKLECFKDSVFRVVWSCAVQWFTVSWHWPFVHKGFFGNSWWRKRGSLDMEICSNRKETWPQSQTKTRLFCDLFWDILVLNGDGTGTRWGLLKLPG